MDFRGLVLVDVYSVWELIFFLKFLLENGNSGGFFCLFEFFSSRKTGFCKLGALASVICGYEFGMD